MPDRARIEVLQRDTQRPALLASIFQEDDPSPNRKPSTPEARRALSSWRLIPLPRSLVNLCRPTFARTLLSRPSWERSELEDGGGSRKDARRRL